MEHVSDDDLERYHLAMVPTDSPEEKAIEEHLLWCKACLWRAEEISRYVDAMRAGIVLGEFDLP